MSSFIDEKRIFSTLKDSGSASPKVAEKVIQKALQLKGLSLAETAVLLQIKSPALLKKLFRAAHEVKEEIYGKRLVLFAPLYVTNYCVNNCAYCGFRSGNKKLRRRRLSIEEIAAEVKLLEAEGHKRLLLVAGEDPLAARIDWLEKVIPAVYRVKVGRGEIRRVNVNVAPMSTKDFKRLKATDIGTYQLFQETYHRQTYRQMHPSGPKANYAYRLTGLHRAMQAGISDVGIGVLFGLYDYKFEVLALLQHAQELEKRFGAGPHTISVPRLESALNSLPAAHPPHPVTDIDFKKIVAILRLAVPYTGLILSTRENAKMRDEVLGLGISQISAGSSTTPGGYSARTKNNAISEQFSLHDSRSLLEVIKDIAKMGYSPSFCTACYRLGRVGQDFMDLAKPGLIHKFCLPNSLVTFQEYLLDYGDATARRIGGKVIRTQLNKIGSPVIKKSLVGNLEKLAGGQRDIYC